MTEYPQASCSECPGKFELVPPDSSYTVAKVKPTSDDYIERNYDCDQDGHRNTIYWQKKEDDMFFSSSPSASPTDKPHASTKYTRGRY